MFSPPASQGVGGSLERGDNLAAKYSSLAGDGSQGPKAREAAMLFSAAELSLNDEDASTAMAKAQDALRLFREVGDRSAVADTLRLVVNAHLEREEAEEALTLATKELEAFQSAGDKRGEAAMLLSIAEITFNNFGSKKREEALASAARARELYKELQDAKMEGIALLALVNCHITKGTKHDSRQELEKSVEMANEAATIFRGIQDQNGEAKALHGLAVAHSYMDAEEDTIRYAKQALGLWRELQVKKFEGMELRCIGEWQLAIDNPKEALKVAEAALKIFEEIGNAKGWEASSLSTVVRAHLRLQDTTTAAQLVKDAARSFQSRADEAGEVVALSLSVEVQLAKDDKQEALLAAEKCLDAVRSLSKRTTADQRFEANMLHTVAQIHLAEDAYAKAKESGEAALKIFKEVGDKQNQGLVLHTLSSVSIGLNEFRDGVKIAAEARDIFRKRGHKRGHAYSCLACGHAYLARGEHNRAISMSKEAHKIFLEEKHRKGEADALSMMAEVYLMKGNTEKSLVHGQEARDLFRAMGQERKELEAVFLVAKASFWSANADGIPQKKGEKPSTEWAKALEAAKEAVTFSRKLDIQESIVAALFGVGQVYVITRRPDEASQLIAEAMPLAQQVGDSRAEANLEILTAQMHIMNSREEQAVDPAKRAIDIFKDKLQDAEGEEVALELIRYVEGSRGQPQGAAAAGGDSEAGGGGPATYQGPTLDTLVATISDVALSLMGVDTLDGDTPLMDAGLDSLASVEFQNNLQKEFAGIQMPSTLVFDFPSVKTMADFIHGGLQEAAGFKAVSD